MSEDGLAGGEVASGALDPSWLAGGVIQNPPSSPRVLPIQLPFLA